MPSSPPPSNFPERPRQHSRTCSGTTCWTPMRRPSRPRRTPSTTRPIYFEENIASITSVDDFLSSSRLKNYVLTAFGLSTEYTSSSFLKDVLTSDLDDADSFVNQLDDDVYVSLAKAFNFNEDGSVDGGLMSEDQISLVTSAYAVASATIASTVILLRYHRPTSFGGRQAETGNTSCGRALQKSLGRPLWSPHNAAHFASTILATPSGQNAASGPLGKRSKKMLHCQKNHHAHCCAFFRHDPLTIHP